MGLYYVSLNSLDNILLVDLGFGTNLLVILSSQVN
jgi:hypothetical protein